eukprot:jgi/Psemu1/15070/gm1.15070_g
MVFAFVGSNEYDSCDAIADALSRLPKKKRNPVSTISPSSLEITDLFINYPEDTQPVLLLPSDITVHWGMLALNVSFKPFPSCSVLQLVVMSFYIKSDTCQQYKTSHQRIQQRQVNLLISMLEALV